MVRQTSRGPEFVAEDDHWGAGSTTVDPVQSLYGEWVVAPQQKRATALVFATASYGASLSAFLSARAASAAAAGLVQAAEANAARAFAGRWLPSHAGGGFFYWSTTPIAQANAVARIGLLASSSAPYTALTSLEGPALATAGITGGAGVVATLAATEYTPSSAEIIHGR